MQGYFTYYNPTKLYFGEESLNKLKGELANCISLSYSNSL